MTIDGIRLLELLPEFMRGDVTAQAYAAALDGLLSYAGAGQRAHRPERAGRTARARAGQPGVAEHDNVVRLPRQH